jgi:hypothetical protein
MRCRILQIFCWFFLVVAKARVARRRNEGVVLQGEERVDKEERKPKMKLVGGPRE